MKFHQNFMKFPVIILAEFDDSTPKLISVPNGISAAIINPTNKISKILVLADVAWKPNDNEMINVEFSNYDWKKWKNH